MGKNTKVMPQNALLSIFFLGKGRESLHLKSYEKLSLQVRFLNCSPACTKLDKASTVQPQNCPKCIFFTRILHLPSNRREGNSALIFQFRTPNKKAHHNTNFGNSKIIHHFGPENPQNPTQKDTNFGNTKIIHHFRPENLKTQPRKT